MRAQNDALRPLSASVFGWGAGGWGRNSWGSGATVPLYQPARLIFFDNWVNDLIWNIQNGNIYYWNYNSSFSNNEICIIVFDNYNSGKGQILSTTNNNIYIQ